MREVLKLALEALEQTLKTLDDENAQPGGAIADTIWYSEHITLFDYLASEITDIKEALAQPEQEPVAWTYQEYRDDDQFGWRDEIQFVQPPNDQNYFRNIVPLYTAPPQRTWVDLTDEEISDIAINNPPAVHEFARAILAKSKEKNNG